MVVPKKVYVCTKCDKVHSTGEKALECCPTEISDQWECSGCGTLFDTEQEAHDCCEDK